MDARPRFMSRELAPGQRRVYGAVTIFFVVVFLAMIWPIYSLFSGIRPVLLGIPFSLFYVVAFLAASFLVLLALFAWEGRAESRSGAADGPGSRADEERS